MANVYNVNFNINPPILIRVKEDDINMDLGLEISGVYSYSIYDDIAFFSQKIDINDPAKRNEFEGRILQSIHCDMSLFWSEKVSEGIAHDDIPDLFDELKDYVINDMQGGFCKVTGIRLESMEFTRSKINDSDERAYRELKYPNNGFDNAAAQNYEQAMKMSGESAPPKVKIPPKTKYKWQCPCGRINETAFCPGCGKPKDATSVLWICSCGKKNNTRFCTNCGNRRE